MPSNSKGEHEVLLPTYQRTRVRIGDAVGVSYLHKDDSAIIPHTTHLTTEEGLQTVTRFDFWGAEIPDTVADAHDVDARPAIEPIWNEGMYASGYFSIDVLGMSYNTMGYICCLGSLTLSWINFNPSMDKWLHA